ncbi:MAG: hypothetical protein GXP29_02250 [Planctomycetes bacterium]|nr:hypothetical protein [Planctomycetota bacterium]
MATDARHVVPLVRPGARTFFDLHAAGHNTSPPNDTSRHLSRDYNISDSFDGG